MSNAITLELSPGDCVLFSTRLLHRTGGNRTKGHRRVVTLHMASAKCKHRGKHFAEFGFTLVKGEAHEGCLRLVTDPSLEIRQDMD